MRNSIILSVFMLAGLFSVTETAAQDATKCATQVKTESTARATSPYKTHETALKTSAPQVLQASLSTTPAQTSAKCQPANCKPVASVAGSVNCDPSLCKNLTCDPNDCPPECKPLCGSGTSVAQMASRQEPACKSAAEDARVVVAKGQ